jgi:hypothetical protein
MPPPERVRPDGARARGRRRAPQSEVLVVIWEV